jgi:uncharacterized protein HemY
MFDYLANPAYTPELILLGIMVILIAICIVALVVNTRTPRVVRKYNHAYRVAKVRQQGRNGFKSRSTT